MSAELVRDIEKSRNEHKDKWVVVMYNDNYTAMDFVVFVLISVFNKSMYDAVNLMLQIHNSSKQVVGMYPEKLANAKVKKTMDLARDCGYSNFRVEAEKV